jgi:hypothetical protein
LGSAGLYDHFWQKMKILCFIVGIMIERLTIDIDMLGSNDRSKRFDMRGLQGTFF